MRNTLVLVLVLGLCSAALGVSANWGEEMNAAPDATFWSGGGTVDYTSRPGSWYGTDIAMTTNNELEPLRKQLAYAVEWRFRLSPSAMPSWASYNMPIMVDNESGGSQMFYVEAGKHYYGTVEKDVCIDAVTRGSLGPAEYSWDEFAWAVGNTLFTQLVADQWYKIRVVSDPCAGKETVYLDGVPVYAFNYLGPLNHPSDPPYFAFGTGSGGSGIGIGVQWDYIRFYYGSLDGTTALDAASDKLTVSPTTLNGFESTLNGTTTPQYTVVLKSAPSANVTVAVDPNDPQVTAAPASLTFTPANWATPQTVTLAIVDRVNTVPSRKVTVKNLASSTDANFNGDTKWVVLNVYHNDVKAALILTGNGVSVAEQTPTVGDTFTVQLLGGSGGIQTVTMTWDPAQLTVTPASLTFLPGTWNTPQTVTVKAVNDAVLESPNPYPVTITLGGAPGYPVWVPSDKKVTVLVDENDCGAWGYPLMDFNHECHVNLSDLATFCANWLKCTKPYGTDCYNAP